MTSFHSGVVAYRVEALLSKQREQVAPPIVGVLLPPHRHVSAQAVGQVLESVRIDLTAESGAIYQPVQPREPEFLVVRVEEGESMTPGHSDDQQAAGGENAPYLSENASLVRNVLEHVEERDRGEFPGAEA